MLDATGCNFTDTIYDGLKPPLKCHTKGNVCYQLICVYFQVSSQSNFKEISVQLLKETGALLVLILKTCGVTLPWINFLSTSMLLKY